MLIYNEDQKRQKERYLALQRSREFRIRRSLAKQINIIRSKVIAVAKTMGILDLGSFVRKALMLDKNMPLQVLKERILFVKLIFIALTTPGLGVPSFAGIQLTPDMVTLIKIIIRKKHDIWMFQLRELWLRNEMARASRGEKVTENVHLNKTTQDSINKMKATVFDARDNVASQHNDYTTGIINKWRKQIIDGRSYSRNLFNTNFE